MEVGINWYLYGLLYVGFESWELHRMEVELEGHLNWNEAHYYGDGWMIGYLL